MFQSIQYVQNSTSNLFSLADKIWPQIDQFSNQSQPKCHQIMKSFDFSHSVTVRFCGIDNGSPSLPPP